MGRRGRGLFHSLLLAALLGVASAPPLAAQSPLRHDAITPPRISYPSNDEILPFWMSLLRMDQASVYRVGPPRDLTLLDEGRDSVGVIAGCPILESARVDSGGDWVDSLRTIVGNPMSYRRGEEMQLVPPEYVIRLRAEDDSMTVMIGAKGSFLYVRPSSGSVIAGWLDRDRAKLAALIDKALHPSKPRANRARKKNRRPAPTK